MNWIYNFLNGRNLFSWKILIYHGSAYVGICCIVALWREGMDQSTWTSTSWCEVGPPSNDHVGTATSRVVLHLRGSRETHRWRLCQKLSCGLVGWSSSRKFYIIYTYMNSHVTAICKILFFMERVSNLNRISLWCDANLVKSVFRKD